MAQNKTLLGIIYLVWQSKPQLICFIRTIWVQFGQIWLTVAYKQQSNFHQIWYKMLLNHAWIMEVRNITFFQPNPHSLQTRKNKFSVFMWEPIIHRDTDSENWFSGVLKCFIWQISKVWILTIHFVTADILIR